MILIEVKIETGELRVRNAQEKYAVRCKLYHFVVKENEINGGCFSMQAVTDVQGYLSALLVISGSNEI